MIELRIRVPDQVFERIRRDAAAHQTQPERIAADALEYVFAPSAEPVPGDVASTVARLRSWVAEQPPSSVRPPLALAQAEREELDRDLETLFADIHQRTSSISPDQVARDVTEALKDE